MFLKRGLFNKGRTNLQVVKEVLVRTQGEARGKTQGELLGFAATHWGLEQPDMDIALQRVVVDAQDGVLTMDPLGKSYWLHGLHHG
ncbi:hypothetical protein IMZ48_35690 [Candidatus Bathyarchaeota archaeon]|nr:hypothetical protein [Candidatus Bathyarchaeota archaeon]